MRVTDPLGLEWEVSRRRDGMSSHEQRNVRVLP